MALPGVRTVGLMMLFVLLAMLPAVRPSAAGPASQLADEIRVETLQRIDRRPATLVRDPTLAEIARAHSRTMFETDTLGHEVGDGEGPGDRVARHHRRLFGLGSENVAVQKNWPEGRDLARSLVDGWMKSPGHRANILASYDTFEVGCFGDQQTVYCTQLFVRSSARLARDLAFEQPMGVDLTLALTARADQVAVDRRISIAPVGGASSDSGAAFVDGAATLTLPDRPGLFQLKLWTREDGDSSRYRIIDGPLLRTVSRQSN